MSKQTDPDADLIEKFFAAAEEDQGGDGEQQPHDADREYGDDEEDADDRSDEGEDGAFITH